jgi:hypothetical protein
MAFLQQLSPLPCPLFHVPPIFHVITLTIFTYNLSVVLYGCEIWSVTLREEHRLRVLKHLELRTKFRLKGDDVSGNRSKLRNDRRDLYYSENTVRVINWRRTRWARHVARCWRIKKAYRVLVRKLQGKRPVCSENCYDALNTNTGH